MGEVMRFKSKEAPFISKYVLLQAVFNARSLVEKHCVQIRIALTPQAVKI